MSKKMFLKHLCVLSILIFESSCGNDPAIEGNLESKSNVLLNASNPYIEESAGTSNMGFYAFYIQSAFVFKANYNILICGNDQNTSPVDDLTVTFNPKYQYLDHVFKKIDGSTYKLTLFTSDVLTSVKQIDPFNDYKKIHIPLKPELFELGKVYTILLDFESCWLETPGYPTQILPKDNTIECSIKAPEAGHPFIYPLKYHKSKYVF